MMLKILYVDDEPDLREIAQMSLELDPQLTVRCCATGKEALEQAKAWQPDLVLLDVMMPGMDGPMTLSRMHQEIGPELPIVFITARAGERDALQLLSLGAIGVIAKPFDPLTLAARLREYLR